MRKKIHNSLCQHAESIVPYLYQEMAESDASVFETHLAGCSSCTDEFAAVADARFCVYEWHKEEFVPLATPHFVVPSGAPERIGVLGQLAAILARPSFAFAGATAVLLLLALFAVSFFRSAEEQVASNTVVPAIGTTPAEAVTTASLPKVDIDDDTEAQPSRGQPVRPIRKSVTRTATASKPPTPFRTIRADEQLRQARSAPVLSNDIELEDESLRLADLFEEVGG